MSIGIAELSSQDVDYTVAIAHADRALYAAKERGRNRTERFEASLTPRPQPGRSFVPVSMNPDIPRGNGTGSGTPFARSGRKVSTAIFMERQAMEYAQMNKAPSSVEEIPTSTEETLRNMRATMEQYMASASERAREAAAYADRTVHQNPWTAVGVGFGIGMVFGALVAMLAARPNQSVIERMR